MTKRLKSGQELRQQLLAEKNYELTSLACSTTCESLGRGTAEARAPGKDNSFKLKSCEVVTC